MSRIEVKDVSKSFKDTQALSCVNLCFEENTIYGLLGRNGAGKSTLLNIINNRLFADSGRVTLDNKSLRIPTRSPHVFSPMKATCIRRG